MMKTLTVAQIAKQLPPSAAGLRLLDVGGMTESALRLLRPDIEAYTVSVLSDQWLIEPASVDAVVAYDFHLNAAFLTDVLRVLRSGGRLIVANPFMTFEPRWSDLLTRSRYVRLLIEALDGERGLLLRGEKPHATQDTLERIQTVSSTEGDTLTLATYRGRFVHLLVRQTPNKPVWKLTPDDVIQWDAVTLEGQGLLAFSSLPKAVALMQQAVLSGSIRDINKVAKFRLEVARDWQANVVLNPTVDMLKATPISFLAIDPQTAEAPDE